MIVKIKKKIFSWVGFFLALTLICNMMFACEGKSPVPVPAKSVLQAMLLTVTPPKGCTRSLVTDNEREKLSIDLLTALYGDAVQNLFNENQLDIIDDCEIFISEVIHPFEIAVFRCRDERDMTSVMGLCAARLDMIQRHWQGSEYETLVQNARVSCYDAYVFLVVTEDPEAAIKSAKKAIQKQGKNG